MQDVDPDQLKKAMADIGDAAIDPGRWPQVMDRICLAVGATGAALLQSDVRTPDVPVTEPFRDSLKYYFENGWASRDLRASRGVPLLLAGQAVFTDQDIVTPEEMRRASFYHETLFSWGLKWSAAIGFRSGGALWGLSIQRTPRQGPFESNDKKVLALLSDRMTEVATLSKAVGRKVLTGVTSALELVGRPALALNRFGSVLDVNSAAGALFDDDIRIINKRLVLRAPHATTALGDLIDRMRAARDDAALPSQPILVRRRDKAQVLVAILAIPGAARDPFLGARVLLVFTELQPRRGPGPAVLSQVFGLSRAEARLASLMATGLSPEQAANELRLSRETIRNQLKAIFAKTDTHRQGELVALLACISEQI